MFDLVTLAEVNIALRLDLEPSDPRIEDVEAKISQASAALLGYLKSRADEIDPSAVPDEIKAAAILLIGSLLDDDKAELVSGLGTSDPRNPVVALLTMRRDPTLA